MDNSSSLLETLNDAQLFLVVSGTIATSCYPTANPTNKFASIRLFLERHGPKSFYVQTGSTAEFSIQPVMSCIGDIDIMHYSPNALIVETDNPKFPNICMKFGQIVAALKMEPVERYPGFVRLEILGRFRFSLKSNKYVFERYPFDNKKYFKKSPSTIPESPAYYLTNSGPAVSISWTLRDISEFLLNDEGLQHTLEMVLSFFSCTWSAIAAEWKIRDRQHCPLPAALIQKIVAGGCDVVRASHPDRQGDRPTLMYRLSFSRAEIMLINSWNYVQQVVYHMLRFFGKHELINSKWEHEDKILCTYHIKTLMLWSCESQGDDFWQRHVICLCCDLLTKLLDSLEQNILPNYFIPKYNLFDHIKNETNRQEVMNKLRRFQTKNDLSRWFLHNYIQKSTVLNDLFAEHCRRLAHLSEKDDMLEEIGSGSLRIICDSLYSFQKEQKRRNCRFSTFYLRKFETVVTDQTFINRKKAAAVGYWFLEYVTAIQLLRLLKHMMKDNPYPEWDIRVFDWVANLYKQWEVYKYPSSWSKQLLQPGRRYFVAAQEIMTGLNGQNSPSEFQLLTKLSIVCLQMCMNAGVSNTDLPIQRTSIIYLAALHYKRNEYSMVIMRCLKVLTYDKGNPKYVNGCLLQFIDEVASIRGFLILCRYFNNKFNIPGSQVDILIDSSFTPRIIARYLLHLCGTRTWKEPGRPMESFTVADQYVIALIKYRIKFPLDTVKETASELTFDPFLNMKSAAERFYFSWNDFALSLRDVYFEKLALAFDIFRNDFEMTCAADILLGAFLIYRCGDYNLVLQVCDILDRDGVNLVTASRAIKYFVRQWLLHLTCSWMTIYMRSLVLDDYYKVFPDTVHFQSK